MRKNILIFIIIDSYINTQIFNNPRLISNTDFPFLFSSPNNDFNYILTSQKSFKLERRTGNIIGINNTMTYGSNVNYIVDSLNNIYLYLYHEQKYYKITYEPYISFQEASVSLQSKYQYISGMSIIGAFAKNNGFIIYGSYSGFFSTYLIFSHNSEIYRSSIEISHLSSKISCKFIVDSEYVCIEINPNNITAASFYFITLL